MLDGGSLDEFMGRALGGHRFGARWSGRRAHRHAR